MTQAVFSTVVHRKSTGVWISRRIMAWLRGIGLEFVDIIVKSDSEPALTSFGRLVGPFSSEEPNGQCEEQRNSEKSGSTSPGHDHQRFAAHSTKDGGESNTIRPWTAKYAGFSFSRSEAGHDGKTEIMRCLYA